MTVFELTLKFFLLQTIQQEDALNKIAAFIDTVLAGDVEMMEMHNKNILKKYVFSGFYPTETDKIYKKETVYQVRIRTVDVKLAEYFSEKLPHGETAYMKGLVCNSRKLLRKHIASIYTLTPAIVKSKSGGYWKDDMSFQEYEKRIKENLIKKYNLITGEKISEDFELYNLFEMTNRVPISVPYKNVRLLADKFQMQIAYNDTAQHLAYAALGMGVCEMNARGFGFVNCHCM